MLKISRPAAAMTVGLVGVLAFVGVGFTILRENGTSPAPGPGSPSSA